jgi:hypothetical protein
MISWNIQRMAYGTESEGMDAKAKNREEEAFAMKKSKVLREPPTGEGLCI